MTMYNTVPAEDTLRQESAPKSWKLKKIVVVSAALSFSLGACAATALSYREVGASRATQLVAQTDCQAKYPNLCSDDGCNCRCPPYKPPAPGQPWSYTPCPTKGCDQSHCHDKTVVKCDGGELCGSQNFTARCAESSRRPPRHRRDACSIARRCWFLVARPSQRGHVVAEKCTRHTG